MYMTQDSLRPRPLATAPASQLAALRWVLTDIDDTLTLDGRLPAAAYAALEALHDAGIAVVPVTGRPAGWCDAIARHWPVAAVVGENGALWYALDHGARRMLRWQAQPEAERLANQARLHALAAEALRVVPGSAIAADQPFRLFDVAVDFCEDAGPLGLDAAERIAEVFRAGGAEAKVSSIHVNAWIGGWDKRAGIEALFAARFQPFADVRDTVAFAGDSANDAPLFAAVACSVGVANVAPFLADMATPPAYITRAEGGAGFAEFAQALLKARGATAEENAA
ncbi:HAD-IIB family hydrolase [Pseudoroseomonas wenyumeiae]|uniref:HAD-IIB family hydrolase n=1 Tax=Teichococcus wenyumeiae TaxID=2478470 RepID=A0A3A9JXF7_9PROT|nr:HAD-IIB family hydrolase [Pseudoroseomonas wenyumeiae]RKK03739.1 HAD-IIB family hydrolase [Pseudoroseomonas wenyumeiae]RMI26270.1 HAD-IIB family hydrolase [Pseudoroseomonas wenyumeiae]